jgi:hypothetical protein
MRPRHTEVENAFGACAVCIIKELGTSLLRPPSEPELEPEAEPAKQDSSPTHSRHATPPPPLPCQHAHLRCHLLPHSRGGPLTQPDTSRPVLVPVPAPPNRCRSCTAATTRSLSNTTTSNTSRLSRIFLSSRCSVLGGRLILCHVQALVCRLRVAEGADAHEAVRPQAALQFHYPSLLVFDAEAG